MQDHRFVQDSRNSSHLWFEGSPSRVGKSRSYERRFMYISIGGLILLILILILIF